MPAALSKCARRWLIQVDGDGAFKSDLFADFCEEYGLDRYPHPSKSPDLALIENAWNMGEDGITDLALAHRKWRDGAERVKANYEAWRKLVKKGIRKVKRRHDGELINGVSSP
jgi:hypothetical protein